MRIALLVIVVTLGLPGTRAFAQAVTYDYDKRADFTRLKTYAWAAGTNLTDELNHKRLVDAIDAQLASKGLVQVDANANPDVLIAYHADFDKQFRINGVSSGFGGYRFGPGPARWGSAVVEDVLVGTIVVELVDAKTRSLVWRGIASREIDFNTSPEKRERNINKGAEKLFRNYPPKP